jgi:hypothetical protein
MACKKNSSPGKRNEEESLKSPMLCLGEEGNPEHTLGYFWVFG